MNNLKKEMFEILYTDDSIKIAPRPFMDFLMTPNLTESFFAPNPYEKEYRRLWRNYKRGRPTNKQREIRTLYDGAIKIKYVCRNIDAPMSD